MTEVISDKLGSHLLRVLVHELRAQGEVFKDLSEAAQEARINYLQHEVNQACEHAIKGVLAAGFPCVVARLKKITVEEGVNAQLTFGNDELHALSDAVGTNVVLVLVDPAAHASTLEDVRPLCDPDQAPLEFAMEGNADGPPDEPREDIRPEDSPNGT